MKTTPERLDELEYQYRRYADCLDASSYDIKDLLHDAREAHRLQAKLDQIRRTWQQIRLNLLAELAASPHDGDHGGDGADPDHE